MGGAGGRVSGTEEVMFTVFVGGLFVWCVSVCAGSSTSGKLSIPLNVNLYDGRGETPLGLALWTEQFDVARQLLEAGVWWE